MIGDILIGTFLLGISVFGLVVFGLPLLAGPIQEKLKGTPLGECVIMACITWTLGIAIAGSILVVDIAYVTKFIEENGWP